MTDTPRLINPKVGPVRVAGYRRDNLVATDALILGDLAIHEDIRPSCALFTLTHVRTGKGVATDLLWRQVLTLYSLVKDLDWAFDDPDGVPQATKRASAKALKEIG